MIDTARIPIIDFDGGPGAGKTEVIPLVAKWLEGQGWHSIIMDEHASRFQRHGFRAHTYRSGADAFQADLFDLMINDWKVFKRAASEIVEHFAPKRVVILRDRTPAGLAAYMEKPAYRDMLRSRGLSFLHVRDGQSDGVIFMRTAAHGAEESYTTDNNDMRDESAQEARARDDRTLEACIGHPHLRIVDNVSVRGWNEKVERVIHEVAGILGIPKKLEAERTWLIDREALSLNQIPGPKAHAELEQVYLTAPNERIRARGLGTIGEGEALFFHATKEPMGYGVTGEIEYLIEHQRFSELFEKRDPRREPIKKRRTYFVFEDPVAGAQVFELDLFHNHRLNHLALLELEVRHMDQPIALPPSIWMPVVEEVTGDPTYNNSHLALRGQVAA